MSNILDGLLARIEDNELRRTLESEVAVLRNAKDFGLVYETHIPETIALNDHPVRRGQTVQRRDGTEETVWRVHQVFDGIAQLITNDGLKSEEAVEDLVVVRRFGDPIYPDLEDLGSIERGDDKPFHVVLN